MTTFQKAVKSQAKLRLGLDGPSGSGKTYTALVAASAIANGGKIAVIDTERSSASLYADLFDFDVLCLDTFHPQKYIDGIHEAEKAGYAVVVIDSLSHAWEGEGGVLDLHDQAIKRQRTENSFTAWKDVTPIHRSLVDAMLQSSCHIIATMRSKTEYVIETVENNGRTVQRPRKIGMAPIQRQGMEYEFTIVGDIDTDHTLSITKSRMSGLADTVITKPDKAFFTQVLTWLNSGAKVAKPNQAITGTDELAQEQPAPEEPPTETPPTPRKPASAAFNPVAALVEWGYAQNNFEASAILNKSPYPRAREKNPDELKAWAAKYRGWRDTGLDVDDSAMKATAGLSPN